MNRFIPLLSLIAALLAASPARAQSVDPEAEPGSETITKVATTAAQFLKLGVGARAIALGGSFVAEASDLSALYKGLLARKRG